MMDPDDCHYYCCGGCSGLFPTLGVLTRHKRHCTGKPSVTECKLFACKVECQVLLQITSNCRQTCTHVEGCNFDSPAVPSKEGRHPRSKRQVPPEDHLKGVDEEVPCKKTSVDLCLTSMNNTDVNIIVTRKKGLRQIKEGVTLELNSSNHKEFNSSTLNLTQKRKRGRPRKFIQEIENQELVPDTAGGDTDLISIAAADKSPKRPVPARANTGRRGIPIKNTEESTVHQYESKVQNDTIHENEELEQSKNSQSDKGVPIKPKRKPEQTENTVSETDDQRLPGKKHKAEICASENPSKKKPPNEDLRDKREIIEAKIDEGETDALCQSPEDHDTALSNGGTAGSPLADVAGDLEQPAEPTPEIHLVTEETTYTASAFEAILAAVESMSKECDCPPDTCCTCQNADINVSNPHEETQDEEATAEKEEAENSEVNSTASHSLYEQLSQYKQLVEVEGKKEKQSLYVCKVCERKFVHLGFFARHLRCHNGTSSGSVWECPECDFTCKKKSALKVHQTKHLKPFMCEYCSYCCAAKKDLDRHLWTHTGEQPYACTECDYRCRQHMALKEHMRKHSGEVLKCDVDGCQFKSTYKWALTNHIANKHVMEKRFQCSDCKYSTSDSGSFRKHLKLHQGIKDYKCSLCEYRGVAKQDIIKHMRTHTKEKVYFCDRCKYSTSHSSGLRLHMMSHLGVKPWQCVLCGYNSISKAKVIRHIKQRHQGAAPVNPDDAIINLGQKLEMNMANYRRASETGEQVVYDIQQIPATGLDEVQVIVQELPEGADILEVTTESAGHYLVERVQAEQAYGGMDVIQLHQFTDMADGENVIITPENVETIIIPVQTD